MIPTERPTLPELSLSHIASAIENELARIENALASLDENYKKPFIASILARIHSILNKISRKSKNRDKIPNELSNSDDCSKESGPTNREDVTPTNTIDSDPSKAQEHRAENAPVETLYAIYQRNNIYDKAGETSSSIDVYWCEKGLGLSDLGQFENALESYKRALEINPCSFKALKDRANVLYKIGRYDEAIDDFKKALDINPQLIDAWYGMGNAMSKLGMYKKAVSAYEMALKVNFSFIDAWMGRGVALGNMAHYQEAAESFDKALEINPLLKEAMYGKYLALQKIKRGEELIKITDKVVAMKRAMTPLPIPAAGSKSGNFLVPVRDDFAAYFLKAGAEFYKNERFEDAANCYQRVTEINPLIPEAWYERGLALYKLGFYEDALQSFESALNIDKRYVDAWNNKGVTLDKLGRYDEAINCYEAILKIKPWDIKAWQNEGLLRRKLGQYQSAFICLK